MLLSQATSHILQYCVFSAFDSVHFLSSLEDFALTPGLGGVLFSVQIFGNFLDILIPLWSENMLCVKACSRAWGMVCPEQCSLCTWMSVYSALCVRGSGNGSEVRLAGGVCCSSLPFPPLALPPGFCRVLTAVSQPLSALAGLSVLQFPPLVLCVLLGSVVRCPLV